MTVQEKDGSAEVAQQLWTRLLCKTASCQMASGGWDGMGMGMGVEREARHAALGLRTSGAGWEQAPKSGTELLWAPL